MFRKNYVNRLTAKGTKRIIDKLKRIIPPSILRDEIGPKENPNNYDIDELSFVIIEDLFTSKELKRVLDAFTMLCKIPTMLMSSNGELLVETGGACSIVCPVRKKKWEVCFNQFKSSKTYDAKEAAVFKCEAQYDYGFADISIKGKTVGTLVIGPLKIENDVAAVISSSIKKSPTINIMTRNGFEDIYYAIKTVAEQLSTLAFQKTRLKEALIRGAASEEARIENAKRYRILFQSANDAIMILRVSDYHILQCNEKAQEIFRSPNPQNMIGGSILRLLPEKQPYGEETKKVLLEKFDCAVSGVAQFFEIVLLRNDGEQFYAEVSVKKFELTTGCYLQGIIRDISERVKMELEKARIEQAMKTADKMQAVGTLAGGIAHDFNNLLQAIRSNVDLIAKKPEERELLLMRLKEIAQCIEAGAQLTDQILGYARGGKYSAEATNINSLVEKVVRMFGRTRKEIQIRSEYAEELWLVKVDRGQIEQVVLNLCINASQAMPTGGKLTLKTKNFVIEKNKLPFPTIQGKYIQLSIEDTGCGMTRETTQRMFEPFFSTRRVGEGTGMGLSTAYGIIKNHSGYIYADSKIGKGTTFYTLLRATEEQVTEKIYPSKNIIIRGSGAVLFVDDEERILNAGRLMIESFGYSVIIANSGAQAIKVYEENKKDIDIVIMDSTMPGMNGIDAAKILKEKYPKILILISTGYTEIDITKKTGIKQNDGFLKKPYKAQVLSEEISRVLNKRTRAEMAAGS